VKPLYRSLAVALGGALIVLVAFWLSESVSYVPLEARSITVLLVVGGGGGLVARRGRILQAAAFLAGAGAAWALREFQPLSLCQSDLIFRPCTVSEAAWMAVPGLVLLIAGSVLFFHDFRRTRPAR
jgi:hypothetical protein